MTYKLRTHQQPSYLHKYINDYVPVGTLRSLNRALVRVPCTKTATAARAFPVAAPPLWNNLPIAVTILHLYQFCRLLKGHLFSLAFG